MKIENSKKDKTVCFSSLKPGDCFIRDGIVAIKAKSDGFNKFMALKINSGNLFEVRPHDMVIPCPNAKVMLEL